MRVSTVAEWHAAGLTQAHLRSLARSGALVRVRHGVYATRSAAEWAKASPARGHALLAIAARAALGRDSVASHQTAALIHGLDLFPAAPDALILTRPPLRKSGRLKSDGIFFHTADLPDDHVTSILGAKAPPCHGQSSISPACRRSCRPSLLPTPHCVLVPPRRRRFSPSVMHAPAGPASAEHAGS